MPERVSLDKPFPWDKMRIRAAKRVAEGRLTLHEIATEAEVSCSILCRWKRHKDFRNYVNKLINSYRSKIRLSGIAVIENRVKSQNDRWLRLQKIIEDRSKCKEMNEVPGGDTGLLLRIPRAVKVWKVNGPDDDIQNSYTTQSNKVVFEHPVDTGLLSEMRQLEKQSATELGQLTKPEVPNLSELISIVMKHVPRESRQAILDGITEELKGKPR